jgi:predicted metalloprotease with PDZ domain
MEFLMRHKIQFISFTIVVLLSSMLFAQPIQLDVDLNRVHQNIFHAELIIPVDAGDLALYYPKWIPGYHEPYGRIADLTGLIIAVDGQTISWQRDFTDVYTFHCQIPAGAKKVNVSLDFLVKPESSATPNLAILEWNDVLLYPAGKPVSEIQFQANLMLPEGWQFGTALPVESHTDNHITFAPVTLETLVDAPVLCGLHYHEVELTPRDGPPHYLSMVCDNEEGLAITPDQIAHYKHLVTEALALFGSHHYKTYRFLLILSDYTKFHGLEHHESSDNRVKSEFLTDPGSFVSWIDLLPHEFVHSWNAKYRRPVGMATPNYHQAKNLKLLWVYEGLTQYLGYLLTARSGLWTPDQFRQGVAFCAEQMTNSTGRTWRPLADTPFHHQLHGRNDGRFWRRSYGHYLEGVLIWLEVDMMIRQQTDGKKSLNDFCRLFFGGQSGVVSINPYNLDNIVDDLATISNYDWKTHLLERVMSIKAMPPLAGIENSGWQFGFGDTVSSYQKSWEESEEEFHYRSSLGFDLEKDGKIKAIVTDKPADQASLTAGMKITAVNNRPFSRENLDNALKVSTDTPIELLIEYQDIFTTYKLDYDGGVKYPVLIRDNSKYDMLSQIVAPLTY